MTLKRSNRFQLEINTLIRKLRAQTLDAEEPYRIAEILQNNTTDELPLPESNVDLTVPNMAGALPWTTRAVNTSRTMAGGVTAVDPFDTVKP